MKNEIKVNDYVRTKRGIIDKVDALYGMIENTVHLEEQKWFNTKNIAKHSQNIIDLIEVGDYVNGHLVFDKASDCVYMEDFDNRLAHIPIIEEDIKTVVTKEMMESISYRVERKD